MIFKRILDAIEMIRVKRSDSDHIDRLNHRWTSILLAVSCIILTTANYGSLPMFCWCPAYFVSAYEKYAQKICWVSETYNIVDDRTNPLPFPAASRRHGDAPEDAVDGRFYDYSNQPQQQLASSKIVLRVSYYQWIPLLLLLQSFLFYFPGLVWKTLAARSGLDLANIVEASDTVQNAIYPERREKTLRYMSRHINRFLTYQNNYSGGCCRYLRGFIYRRRCFCCGNRFGNYLSWLYLGLKLVNLVNIVLQVLFIDFYLGSHFHLLGVAFLHGVSTNQTVESATAIASNHPAIAHILANSGGGNTGYSSQNAGHMVKRDLGQAALDSLLSTKESSLFTTSGVNISNAYVVNKNNLEIILSNESLFMDINASGSTNQKLGHFNSDSINLTHFMDDNHLVDPDLKIKPSNKTKRDDRGTSHDWSQRQRKYKRRPASSSFDWSSYTANLRSFPYLSSKLFPKITYCDFTIRQMTTIQQFTTQCVLSINFINEKLFLMLWFWFCLLFAINVYSLIVWSLRLCSKTCRETYIRRSLAMIQRRIFLETAYFEKQVPAQTPRPSMGVGEAVTMDPAVQTDDVSEKIIEQQPLQRQGSKRLVKFEENISAQERSEISYEQAIMSFIYGRLKQDGIFILKILATNTTRLVELDVLALLWSVHERRMSTNDPQNERRESTVPSISDRRDTIVDITELKSFKAKSLASEHHL